MHKHVILAGAGCSNPDAILEIGVPVLSSWQAADKFDSDHPNYFGRPGIYGQRIANRVLYEAERVAVVGNRQSIWNVGYEGVPAHKISDDIHPSIGWMDICRKWRSELPIVESPTHDDANGYINSYRFTDALHKYLRLDEIIVTDMGTPLICAHQVLRLKPPQRIMTSGGLGEMGCALPASIGASFARGKGDVLCLHADGGMMLNLQELQTIAHHKLPIKIIVYRNEAYGMIQNTQKNASMAEVGVAPESGVSFPDYVKVADAMRIPAADIRTWEDFNYLMPMLFASKGPMLLQYHMEPRQRMAPKLEPIFVDGQPTSPRFCDMSPIP